MLSVYVSFNRDGMLVVPDGGAFNTPNSRRRVFVGGPQKFEDLSDSQITALVQLAYRCDPKDLGKHVKVRFYDGVRWARTERKYTLRIHSMV